MLPLTNDYFHEKKPTSDVAFKYELRSDTVNTKLLTAVTLLVL